MRIPIANLIRWQDKPITLLIIQARLMGNTFFIGYIFTYEAFLSAETA